MKILSVRKGFLADHSSTSYEFLAVDKPLDAKAKEAVSKLSSRVRPTSRRAHFTYDGEWSDLPCGWERLMERYYDVMCSESYDWWTLAMAFPATKKLLTGIRKYEFQDEDGRGVYVSTKGKRAIVSVHCMMDSDELLSLCGYDGGNEPLLDVLGDVRKRILAGDYSALYAVWKTYGCEDDEDAPRKPPRYQKSTIARNFKRMLATP